MQWTESWF